jgi:hypothetical protein
MINASHEKPTLLVLRRKAHLSSEDLARAAEVPLALSYAVEIGGFCREETALKVLAAFNSLSHSDYSLTDIRWLRPVAWASSTSQAARNIIC